MIVPTQMTATSQFWVPMNWKTLQCMLDSGKMDLDMEEANKFGAMDLNMKEIGRIMLLMAREGLYTPMEMYMKESGSMIKLMERVNTLIWMAQLMKEDGMKINNTVLEWKHGQMEPDM